MKTRKFNILHMPFLSFASKRFYRDVAHNWKGSNLAYLFVLLAVCCLPAAMQIQDLLLKVVESKEVELLHQLPSIDIRNGVAVADVPQPYYIKDNYGQPVAIIDTTGSMNYIDDASVMAMLTENKLIVRRSKNTFKTVELSEFGNLHIDQALIAGWLHEFERSIAPITYAVLFVASFLVCALAMLVLAVGISLVLAFTNINIRFFAITRIATVAITPALICMAASVTLGYPIMAEIYLGATAAYFLAGLAICGSSADAEVATGANVDLKAVLREEDEMLSRAA